MDQPETQPERSGSEPANLYKSNTYVIFLDSDPRPALMDILERLQAAMHGESAIHAPRTTEAIEAMREAKAEIDRLTAEVTEDHALLVASAAEIERLQAKVVRLQRNLNGRDAFLGRKGLWDEFVASLPRTDTHPHNVQKAGGK